MDTATFGAGCFWGVEARFAQLPGVIETAVGYEGGELRTRPTKMCAPTGPAMPKSSR